MDIELKTYLENIEKYLRHIDIVERTDIIEEIKSSIIDMKNTENLTNEQIINRLGSPKELAKCYFTENLQKSKSVKLINVFNIINFYSAISLITLIVVPTLGIISVTFIFSSFLTLLASIIVIFKHLFNLENHYILANIGISWTNNIFIEFSICILASIILYIVGKYSWKLLIKYIKTFIIKKHNLQKL